MGVDAQYGGVVTNEGAGSASGVQTDVRAIAIIGAGPAGLIAAEILATAGYRVTLYERMPSPARKFLMAGRGGLNLTHSEPLETFRTRYGGGADRVQRAIALFPPSDLIAWANALGQETFTGSSGRVFPKAMKASPLLRAWLKRLDELGVSLKTRHTWTGFDAVGGLTFTGPEGAVVSVHPAATVLALGGASWPKLGSDGSWVSILQRAGVASTPLSPSNCGVLVPWSSVLKDRCAGLPLKRIAVHFGGKTQRGDLIITRTGLEGGAIYALGPLLRQALHAASNARLTIDLKPDMLEADLAARLGKAKPGQSLANTLRKAASLDPAAIALAREGGTALPRRPEDLARHLKAVPVTVTGLGTIDRAISTAGGVAAAALDENFMLTARPGVFAAGEMLDWDAPTGGYLLQACFATGTAAAHGVLQWLESGRKNGQNRSLGDRACSDPPVR